MRETPGELGLPKKFKFWRDGQQEAIDAVFRSNKPVYLLDAPTGVGKSVIGVGSYSKIATTRHVIDALKGEEQPRYRCLYVTRTKQLQDQVLREFPMARTIKGRNNYPCNMFPEKFPEITAEDCQRDKCSTACAYKIAKNEALHAPVAVLNDSYFLAEANGPAQFSGANLVILDECVPAGTQISCLDGYQTIESLKAGDEILGYKEGKIVVSIIENVSIRETQESLLVTNGLPTTPNHPIWTENRGYVPAVYLNTFDRVGTIAEGQGSRQEKRGLSPLTRVEYFTVQKQGNTPSARSSPSENNGPRSVYNLKTTTHNYFANNLLVHNCDSLENVLMNFIQMNLTERQLTRLQIKPPAKAKRYRAAEWLGWAETARYEAKAGMEALQKTLDETDLSQWSDVELQLNRQLTRLQNFVMKLNSFIQDVNEFWVFEYEEDTKSGWKATFKPVRVAEYTSKYLWRHGNRFLGMSGTIFDAGILANDLGITEWDYSRMDSPFPVENRPIYYNPLVDLKYATMATELPKLADAVEKILGKYTTNRVLVHTVSYHVRDYLMGHLTCQERLMTHNSDNRDAKLEEFKASLEPAVMISPSFDRGVDLPHETCRCVIICKVPYLNLSDRQVSARMAQPDGQRWYDLKAAQSIVQMSGRAVRSKTDYCDTYILDRQFSNLLARTRHIVPKWWVSAIIREKGEI